MTKKVLIEQNKRFSKSYLWQLQREYFEKEGINAWVSQVPFFVTSNPVVANCYATQVVHFIKDCLNKNPEARKHTFYLMELGTGSGQVSFFIQKKLHEMLHELKMDDIKICYIMSDFTESNIKYWETHPKLKPFLDQGILDFAIYNLENDDPITLYKKKITLTPEHFFNPIIVFANYIFDTVSHDIFHVSDGRLHEVLVSLTTDQDNMRDGKVIDGEKISIDYSTHEIRGPYYSDPHLNAVLADYPKKLKDTNFLFPIGGLNAIKKLKKLTNDKIYLISSDKGYSTVESLDNLGYPTLAFHGSFSMMVNFHAIAEYFKVSGGDYFLQSERKGIKTEAFASGFKFKDMPETLYAIKKVVEYFSPADYFILHRRMSDSFPECNLDTLASHMAFSGWDPYIFHKLNSRITATIDDAESATIQYMQEHLPTIIDNFYYLPKADNTYFEVAVFYHMTKQYEKAAEYYQQSEPLFTDGKFGLYYNLALCQYHGGKAAEAFENFRKALELDPESKEAKEWVTFLDSSIRGDGTLIPPIS